MIYVVTGHPRSGTSMMMQACIEGGMRALYDSRRNTRWTYEPQFPESTLVDWPGPGRAGQIVKVLSMYLQYLAPYSGLYSFVIMRRDAGEIARSGARAFRARWSRTEIEHSIDMTRRVLRNRRDVMDWREIWYPDVLEDPRRELTRLGWPIDVERAVRAVIPEKRHIQGAA